MTESPWARAVRETQALTVLGRYDEALARLRSALDDEHDEAEWWALRAGISAARDHRDDARSSAAKAVALDPENGVRRAFWVLLSIGWLDPAVLARRHGHPTRRQRRSEARAAPVEDPTATPLAQAARAVELSPASEYCWYALCRARAAVWDLDGAAEAAQRCGSLAPGSSRARLAVASVAEYRHDWAAALAEFRALRAEDPSDDWVHERIARIELVIGEPVEAIADLVTAGRTTVSPARRRRLAAIVEAHVTAQGIVTVWRCALALVVVIVAASILGPPPLPAALAIGVLTAALGAWVRRRRRAVLAVLPAIRRAQTEARFIRFDRTFSLVAVLAALVWVAVVWHAPAPTPARMAADRAGGRPSAPRYRTTCTTVPTAPTFTTPSSLGPPLPPAPPVTVCVPQVETGGPAVTPADVAEAARVARVHQLWYLLALIPPVAAAWAWRPRRRSRDGWRESGRFGDPGRAYVPITGSPAQPVEETDMDLDTDGDGIIDQVATDTNCDGVNDTFQLDTNHDGLIDQTAFDTNGDGVADSWQLDSNQDGLVDGVAIDSNADGLVDVTTADSDQDGITELFVMDTNADGVFDTTVTDVNEDGVADATGSGGDWTMSGPGVTEPLATDPGWDMTGPGVTEPSTGIGLDPSWPTTSLILPDDPNVDTDLDGIPDVDDSDKWADQVHDRDGDGISDGYDKDKWADQVHDRDDDGISDGYDKDPWADQVHDRDDDTVSDGYDSAPNDSSYP